MLAFCSFCPGGNFTMNRHWAVAFSFLALLTLLAQPQAKAQSPNSEDHVIKVLRDGTVLVTPDLGILVMFIQSSESISAEAVAANAEKAKAVESALSALPTFWSTASCR